MTDLESLKTAKAALAEGLISEEDYKSVKDGFIAAQKLKTGVDAGILRKEDYDKSRDAFFELMGVTGTYAPQNKTSAVRRNPPATSHTVTQTSAPRPKPAAHHTTERKTVRPSDTPKTSTHHKPVAPSKGPTSMSGISVNPTAIEEYKSMQSRSIYQWMTFQINQEGTEVILAETGDGDSTFEEFCGIFEEGQCKYGVFDFPYEAEENRSFNKIVFFNWAPDSAPVKQKMMFASTKGYFKQTLDGIQVEMHCTDSSDLSGDSVRSAIKATLTRQ